MAEVQNIMPQSPWATIDPFKNNDDLNTYQSIQKRLQDYAPKSAQTAAQNNLENVRYQDQINNLPVQTDLTPLMQLADAWSGSKLTQTYKPPTTPAERIGMMQKIQSEIDKNSDNMDDNQIKILKTQLETQAQKENKMYQIDSLKAQKDIFAANRAADKQYQHEQNELKVKQHQDEIVAKHFDTAVKGYDSDTKETRQKLDELENLKTTLDSALTSKSAAAELAIDRARFTVPSRLSDVEIHALGYKDLGSFQDRMEQAYQTAKNGTITQDNYNDLKANLALKEKHLNAVLAKKGEYHATRYSNKTGIPIEDARFQIIGKELPANEPSKEAASGPESPIGYMFRDEATGTVHKKIKAGIDSDKTNWEDVK